MKVLLIKKIFNYIFIIALFLLIGIGCQSPVGNVSLPEPNPASADITLDSTNSATKIIGSEGGMIEIAGTDGKNYRFTIPKGFLVFETEISMTPITSLTSPMLKGFAAGVHFEPDGLVLPGVAWLEITGGVVEDNLMGFTYEGNGDEVALSWAELDGSTIRIPISHFSGAGAGTPAPGAGDMSPTNSYRAMTSLISEAYRDNAPECIDSKDFIGALALKFYENKLKTDLLPLLEFASKDDQLLAFALKEYIEWLGWPEYVEGMVCFDLPEGIDGKMEEKAYKLIETGLKNAVDTAADYCAVTHDIGEAKHMIEWVAVSQLLARILDDEFHLDLYVIEPIKDCLTFELQFSSLVETKEGNASGFSGDLSSTIEPIIPEDFGQMLGWVTEENANERAIGPLKYTPTLKYPSKPGCKVVINRVKTEPAEALLPVLVLPKPIRNVNPYMSLSDQEDTDQNDTGDENKEVMLIFYPLKGSEFVDVTCSDLWGGPIPEAFGPETFNYLHEDTMYPKYGGFRIMLEVKGSGKLYAQKKIERTLYEDGVMITERTTFDLFHKPKGGQ